MRRFWTAHELKTLAKLYPHFSTAYVAGQLKRSVAAVYGAADAAGLKKSKEYLSSPDACRLRKGDGVGSATRFKPGQVPANKGLRRPGWGPGRMKETQFKKGTRLGAAQHNWVPVGTIRKDHEGYLRIKVREHVPGEHSGFGNTKVWPLMQRHVWEQHYGPIPAGHAICFKDGNRDNCNLANLECVSRPELMKRNTVHNLPKELAEIVQLRGALNRKIRNHAKNKLSDLRNHLFAAPEGLSDKDNPLDLDRARAIADVAKVVVDSAIVEVKFMAITGEITDSSFFPEVPDALPGERRPSHLLRGGR